MIKIDKDYNDIPLSLKPVEHFTGEKIPPVCKTTHAKRLTIIKDGHYTDSEPFNSRYKYQDIKDKLNKIYHHKCAYCESRLEQLQVEHYRPKKGAKAYYWLVYSWDNLLLACPACNRAKGDKFEIKGRPVSYVDTPENIKNINTLSASYDALEFPLMVNPEVTDPEDILEYTEEGEALSKDERFKYTIETCQLNRNFLKDERRKIFEDFRKKVRSIFLENREEDRKLLLIHLINSYMVETEDLEKSYLGIRKYAIRHNWFAGIIKSVKYN